MSQENKQFDMFADIVETNREPDRELPEGIHLRQGELWCPYCSKQVRFLKDKSSGVRRCPYCKISDRDYHVKRINQRWL